MLDRGASHRFDVIRRLSLADGSVTLMRNSPLLLWQQSGAAPRNKKTVSLVIE